MKGNFGLIVAGAIGILIAIVMGAVAVDQLDTVMTAEAALTNTFQGLGEIMGIYGIVFFIAITGAALAMFGFGTYGVIKSRRSRKAKKSRR